MLKKALEATINHHAAETGSNTPDFILAEFLSLCLEAFDKATRGRDQWYDVKLAPGARVLGGHPRPFLDGAPEPAEPPPNAADRAKSPAQLAFEQPFRVIGRDDELNEKEQYQRAVTQKLAWVLSDMLLRRPVNLAPVVASALESRAALLMAAGCAPVIHPVSREEFIQQAGCAFDCALAALARDTATAPTPGTEIHHDPSP